MMHFRKVSFILIIVLCFSLLCAANGSSLAEANSTVSVPVDEAITMAATVKKGHDVCLYAGNKDNPETAQWYVSFENRESLPVGETDSLVVSYNDVLEWFPEWDGESRIYFNVTCKTSNKEYTKNVGAGPVNTLQIKSANMITYGEGKTPKAVPDQRGLISVASTNDWSENRPVIIFFAGTGTCNNIGKAIDNLARKGYYNGLDANFVIGAFKNGVNFDVNGYTKTIAQEVVDYIAQFYDKDNPFDIIVEGVSFGGMPACSIIERFKKAGMKVTEVNLFDGLVYNRLSAQKKVLQDAVDSGAQINAWISSSLKDGAKIPISCDASNNGFELTPIFSEYPNYKGTMVTAGHCQVIDKAYFEEGLHSEFRYGK